MTWDSVYSWSQILVVLFAGVALVSGLVVNKHQSLELLEQREKTAKAEKSLLELQQLLHEPRTVDQKLANEILDWGAKGSVEMSCTPTDESRICADDLADTLGTHGWSVHKVGTAIVAGGVVPGIEMDLYGFPKGQYKVLPEGASEAVKTLYKFFSEAVKGNAGVDIRCGMEVPQGATKDKIRVIVGPKF